MASKLQPCDEGFFETAPTRYVDTMDVPLPADLRDARASSSEATGRRARGGAEGLAGAGLAGAPARPGAERDASRSSR